MPVLVVDDDDAVRLMYASALERAGFSTLQAADGPSALSLLETEQIGLLLIDNQMPGMTGMQVIERIRSNERTRTLPAVLLTGMDDVPARIRGLEAGANDYVVKTTRLDEVVARVRAQVRARVAWADVLGRELEQRARVVMELGSIPAGDTAEETAAVIVEHLSRLPMISFVNLLQVQTAGGLAPLAGWSATKGTWIGGMPLPPATAEYVIGRADAGPWIEEPGEFPAAGGEGPFPRADTGIISAAPMRLRDRLVGVLSVGTLPGASALGAGGDLLAATIDYAAVATAVLGPALEARGRELSNRQRLEAILAKGAFHPVFQPLVDLSSGDVVGFEALTRFDDGMRPDLRFIEAAKLGVGREFEEAAIRAILGAADRLPPGRWLGINVSPELVLQPHWLERLIGLGGNHRYVIELTEHAPIGDYESLRVALKTLPASVAVAVDDAGAGYASLRHIYELRPRFVKLDMALVRNIDRDPVRQALVAGLVHFAEDTGSQLIAEGIETEREASVMRRLNVTLGQGYLYGHPSDAESWSPVGEPPAARRPQPRPEALGSAG
jgi:EAL domain-containing protein (putative c-di-GMP-specific phosphodiesterase class I)/DNA-binding NarL/FixJ family response regulator